MTVYVFKNASIYNGGYDHSGELNSVDLKADVEMQNATTFVSTTKANIPGLIDIDLDVEGFFDASDPGNDALLFGLVGTINNLISIYPQGSALGYPGYAFQSAESQYSPKMRIGNVAAFGIKAKGSGLPLVNIDSLFTPVAQTASGNGTGVNIGAITAGKTLYSFLHVITFGGTAPSITVTVQSSTTQGGTYTTRLTHTSQSGVAMDLKTLAGPITDTWWRVAWSISGTTPSFTFVVGAGIQ
jgi:hypothetical protein